MALALVTGGAGFIGSHTCEAFVGRDDEVVCLDSFHDYYPRELKERNLEQLRLSDRFHLVEGDLCNATTVEEVFSRYHPSVVVHLAARAGVRPSLQEPEEYLRVNTEGTLNMLRAAVQHPPRRFVFASSSSVYGCRNSLPYSEDQDITHPVSPYAASKVGAEALCFTYHHLYQLPVTCLRFFTVFGPRQRPDLAINTFVRLMLADQPIQMFGDGSSSRDYTFVGDVARAILAAADTELDFETINIGNSHPLTLRELVAAVGQAVGKEPRIEQLPAQPGVMLHTYADISKAKTLLGWEPQVSMEEGLAEFVRWHRETALSPAVS
ncbi:MAG: GDP-mannose 4,6-dehydratase [Armatimonadia bacterium]